jgi:hypothetical protein
MTRFYGSYNQSREQKGNQERVGDEGGGGGGGGGGGERRERERALWVDEAPEDCISSTLL